MISELLFAVHGGMYRDEYAGIVMSDHCLPIAIRESEDNSDDGLFALWQSTCDAEEFFEILEIDHCPEGPGLYYLRVDFFDENIDATDDPWGHLVSGKEQEPRPAAIERVIEIMSEAGVDRNDAIKTGKWRWL